MCVLLFEILRPTEVSEVKNLLGFVSLLFPFREREFASFQNLAPSREILEASIS